MKKQNDDIAISHLTSDVGTGSEAPASRVAQN